MYDTTESKCQETWFNNLAMTNSTLNLVIKLINLIAFFVACEVCL